MSLLRWKYALENVEYGPLGSEGLEPCRRPSSFLEFPPSRARARHPISEQIIYFSTNRRAKKKQQNRSGKKLAEQLRILEPRRLITVPSDVSALGKPPPKCLGGDAFDSARSSRHATRLAVQQIMLILSMLSAYRYRYRYLFFLLFSIPIIKPFQ